MAKEVEALGVVSLGGGVKVWEEGRLWVDGWGQLSHRIGEGVLMRVCVKYWL